MWILTLFPPISSLCRIISFILCYIYIFILLLLSIISHFFFNLVLEKNCISRGMLTFLLSFNGIFWIRLCLLFSMAIRKYNWTCDQHIFSFQFSVFLFLFYHQFYFCDICLSPLWKHIRRTSISVLFSQLSLSLTWNKITGHHCKGKMNDRQESYVTITDCIHEFKNELITQTHAQCMRACTCAHVCVMQRQFQIFKLSSNHALLSLGPTTCNMLKNSHTNHLSSDPFCSCILQLVLLQMCLKNNQVKTKQRNKKRRNTASEWVYIWEYNYVHV